MPTRRGFTGFASCAICGLTGFIATDASAQGAPPAGTATPGVNRKILSQTDGPMPGYVTIVALAEIAAGTKVARHTHPGIESAYLLEGEFELPVGDKTLKLKSGDAFQVPPNTPHAGGEPSKTNLKLALTYVVEKDKPLASPA